MTSLPKTIKKAFTKYKLNDGQEFTYGYGWFLSEINGVQLRKHSGSVFGFKSMEFTYRAKIFMLLV